MDYIVETTDDDGNACRVKLSLQTDFLITRFSYFFMRKR